MCAAIFSRFTEWYLVKQRYNLTAFTLLLSLFYTHTRTLTLTHIHTQIFRSYLVLVFLLRDSLLWLVLWGTLPMTFTSRLYLWLSVTNHQFLDKR